jgi:hypothetical protein
MVICESDDIDQSRADVDDAVEAREKGTKDPTGGRGLNGAIGKALEEGREEGSDIAKNAV